MFEQNQPIEWWVVGLATIGLGYFVFHSQILAFLGL
jgi:hypothetical protein